MYPVVADVDNDGGVEIVLTAHAGYVGGAPQRAGITVIGDANDNWTHARRIWNQWNYHITNVHEDASIPTLAADNWPIYNNHRTQAALADVHPWAAPDLSVSRLVFNTQNCPAGAGITARIGNGGSVHAPADLPVTFYDGNPAAGGSPIGSADTTRVLAPGAYEDVTLDLAAPAAGLIYATVNPTPTASLVITDNLALLPDTWATAYGLCNGGCAVPVNFNVFRGIDGNPTSYWVGYTADREVDPRPYFFEVRFPFPVNAVAVTVHNNAGNDAFLGEAVLSFSNGYTTSFMLDANGAGSVSFPEQRDITWVRMTTESAKAAGPGLGEFIVGGSYTPPSLLLREGRMDNNVAASVFAGDPCDPSANRAPQIMSAPPLAVTAGDIYTYSVQATDVDGDDVTFSLPTAPADMTIDGNVITWTATVTGNVPVTVQAVDGQGGVAQQTFTLFVAAANQAPQFTSTPPIAATVGVTVTYGVAAADPDGDAVVLSLAQAPVGAVLDAVTGVLTWTPSPAC